MARPSCWTGRILVQTWRLLALRSPVFIHVKRSLSRTGRTIIPFSSLAPNILRSSSTCLLALLIAAFDPGIATDDPTESYRFRTTVGLVTLTIVSTALFGMGQAISEMRTQKAMIPYMFLPVTTFSVISAILLSRIVVILGFSLLFFVGAFWMLDVQLDVTAALVARVTAAVFAASFFSFAVVLPLLLVSKNATTVIALANVVNIYAVMSAGVFIPLEVMPDWSRLFITTSPFYTLNLGVRQAFDASPPAYLLVGTVGLVLVSALIVYLSSRRKLMVPA